MTEQEKKELRKFLRESKKRVESNNQRFQQTMKEISNIQREIWNAL